MRMVAGRANRLSRGSLPSKKNLLLACALILSLWSLPAWSKDTFTFSLVDADISAVISTVADLTGKNFIVDPRVKGKVTVISHDRMTPDQIYQVFLSLLEVHGFAAVPAGKVIKIVPNSQAKQDAMPVASSRNPGRGDEIVTRVIEIENVVAAQLVPILRPLVPQQGHLVAYAPSNVLIISDRAANIQRLLKIIRRIDQPGGESEVEIVPLEHASATEMVRTLTSLVQQTGQSGGKGKSAPGQGEAPVIIADERTNSILLSGPRSQRLRVRSIIAHLDTPLESDGLINVVYLRYAKAKDLVPVLTGVGEKLEEEKAATGAVGGGASSSSRSNRSNRASSRARGRAGSNSGSNLNIQADETTNALVITAPPDIYRSLRAVIAQLDIRRAQVMVEAVVAEVSNNRATELGIQWVFGGSPPGDRPIGISNLATGSSSIASVGAAAAALDGSDGGSLPGVPQGLTLALGNMNSSGFGFAGLIRALEGDGSTNVLAKPNVVTLDNEEAKIFIGQKVSIPSGSFSSTGGSSNPQNPFVTFNRENIGITLEVKPQINEGDAIKLDILQKIEGIQSGSAGTEDLVTNERRFETSVLVDDGEVLVLGGLLNDTLNENEQKVPVLGDIPILGHLFRYKRTLKDKVNLMVFLHPTILRDKSRAAQLTNAKYTHMRDQQLVLRERSSFLLNEKEIPVLPEMSELLELPPPMPGMEHEGQEELLQKNITEELMRDGE